jgi:hypothetical protein
MAGRWELEHCNIRRGLKREILYVLTAQPCPPKISMKNIDFIQIEATKITGGL